MPVKRTHLGEAELEIMQILWSAREPRTASQILAQLQGRDPIPPLLESHFLKNASPSG